MCYIVMTSSAKMPSSVRAPYRNVAVVLIEEGAQPKMISARAKGVIAIHTHYGPQHAKGKNTAYNRTLREAEALAVSLNREKTAKRKIS